MDRSRRHPSGYLARGYDAHRIDGTILARRAGRGLRRVDSLVAGRTDQRSEVDLDLIRREFDYRGDRLELAMANRFLRALVVIFPALTAIADIASPGPPPQSTVEFLSYGAISLVGLAGIILIVRLRKQRER